MRATDSKRKHGGQSLAGSFQMTHHEVHQGRANKRGIDRLHSLLHQEYDNEKLNEDLLTLKGNQIGLRVWQAQEPQGRPSE